MILGLKEQFPNGAHIAQGQTHGLALSTPDVSVTYHSAPNHARTVVENKDSFIFLKDLGVE